MSLLLLLPTYPQFPCVAQFVLVAHSVFTKCMLMDLFQQLLSAVRHSLFPPWTAELAELEGFSEVSEVVPVYIT